MGKHELVWGIPTLGILGQAWQQLDLLKEDPGRVGGCAGFSGRGTEPRPSFSQHQRSHTESGPWMTLHTGEKGHSTWQGKGEMGLWRQEAWSLVPAPS